MIKKLSTNELKNWLDELAGSGKLYGPRRGDKVWGKVERTDDLASPDDVPFSPKCVFIPQRQALFECVSVDEVESIVEVEPDVLEGSVLWGLRPCDARALEMVCRVMNEGEHRDVYFNFVWGRIVRVALGCVEPKPECFCTSFSGGSPFGTQGVDVMATNLGEHWLLEAITQRGEELISSFDDATEKDAERLAQVKAEATGKVDASVPTDIAEEMLTLFDDEHFWKTLGERCQSCGTCTFVCPGCYCFDIIDDETQNTLKRYRIWDSCVFEKFTLTPSGRNPREQKYRRIRQRFMHKLSFYALRYDGTQLCVGCGRCIRECPAGIDIREVAGRAESISAED